MGPTISDGYTRHVGVGDGLSVPEIEFAYRPLRGPELQMHFFDLAQAEDRGPWMVQQLASRLEWIQLEQGGPQSLKLEEIEGQLTTLDGFAFQAMYNVVFSNTAPARVFDREEPLAEKEQDEADAKN